MSSFVLFSILRNLFYLISQAVRQTGHSMSIAIKYEWHISLMSDDKVKTQNPQTTLLFEGSELCFANSFLRLQHYEN